jgi:hypothetical protein
MNDTAEVIPLGGVDAPRNGQDTTAAPDLSSSIRLIQRWRKILALRWLALFALLGAVAVWGLTVVDPDAWRFVAACGYSVGVLIPSFTLYFLRSD